MGSGGAAFQDRWTERGLMYDGPEWSRLVVKRCYWTEKVAWRRFQIAAEGLLH